MYAHCTLGDDRSGQEVCSWYAIEVFIRRATKLVTGPYRKGDIRLIPINLPLHLLSPLYRPYTSCLRYKNYALLQQNLRSLKPVNVVACKPGQHPGPQSTFARDTKGQVQSWSATRPAQRPKNRLQCGFDILHASPRNNAR
jgi:hypothetical protein